MNTSNEAESALPNSQPNEAELVLPKSQPYATPLVAKIATATKDVPAPKDTQTNKDQRREPRIYVRWHGVALIEGQGVYQGMIKDISASGTDFFLDTNLQKVQQIKLRIYVPPQTERGAPRIMEVTGRVIYTAYDSTEYCFHTGIKFTNFKMGSDLDFLRTRINTFNGIK